MGASCPHGLEAKIPHWWSLRNVSSHEQTVPKFRAKTILIGPLLPQQKETVEIPQNRRFWFDVCSPSPWAHLYRRKCTQKRMLSKKKMFWNSNTSSQVWQSAHKKECYRRKECFEIQTHLYKCDKVQGSECQTFLKSTKHIMICSYHEH
jgi:hypothetical protein